MPENYLSSDCVCRFFLESQLLMDGISPITLLVVPHHSLAKHLLLHHNPATHVVGANEHIVLSLGCKAAQWLNRPLIKDVVAVCPHQILCLCLFGGRPSHLPGLAKIIDMIKLHLIGIVQDFEWQSNLGAHSFNNFLSSIPWQTSPSKRKHCRVYCREK